MNKKDTESSDASGDGRKAELTDPSLTARRYYLAKIAAAGGSLFFPNAGNAQQTDQSNPDNKPLDFGFIKQPLGEMIPLGLHRLHSLCLGDADVTVLFEPGLGGSSLEWLPIAEEITNRARACIYDRAGYAWSDPGNSTRHVTRLASEARQLLSKLDIDNKVILVGHSYGGLIMRQLASTMPDKVLGLILVDASHEEQFTRLAGESSKSMLPTSNNFVVSAPELPAGLRDDIKKKVQAFSRMRKTYTALHAEISSFRDSCTYIKQTRGKFDFPVVVISRGLDPYIDTSEANNKDKIWHELQTDLLTLSDNSQQIIASESGHHIHIDQPELIIESIDQLLLLHSK